MGGPVGPPIAESDQARLSCPQHVRSDKNGERLATGRRRTHASREDAPPPEGAGGSSNASRSQRSRRRSCTAARPAAGGRAGAAHQGKMAADAGRRRKTFSQFSRHFRRLLAGHEDPRIRCRRTPRTRAVCYVRSMMRACVPCGQVPIRSCHRTRGLAGLRRRLRGMRSRRPECASERSMQGASSGAPSHPQLRVGRARSRSRRPGLARRAGSARQPGVWSARDAP